MEGVRINIDDGVSLNEIDQTIKKKKGKKNKLFNYFKIFKLGKKF